MQNIFNHILVPVNFNKNTGLVMQKAIELANEFDASIHLLYVQTPLISLPLIYEGIYIGSNNLNNSNHAAEKINTMKKEYGRRIKPGLEISSSVVIGSWFAMMKEAVITYHIDLVVIPRSHSRVFGELLSEVNLSRLSQQTNCPVLTVTPELDISQLKNIVVPVNDFLPIRKLKIAAFLAQKFNAKIHLTASGKKKKNKKISNDINDSCLEKSFQLVNKYTEAQVHDASGTGDRSAADPLDFAKMVNADLIVVNPGKESKPGKWFSNLLGRYLYRKSDIPVLTIAPQQ